MAETMRTENAAAVAAGPDPRWYACYTRARHEKRVERMLQERAVETFLPLVPRESQWKDRRKTVDWPLFPGYVFGRFDVQESYRILSVPGVVHLVKADGRPVPIDEAELDNVRLFARALRSGADVEAEPCTYFAEGEWVEVTDGPFAGVRGVVSERRGRRRVVIGLHAIGQGMELQIETRYLRALEG
jgi:transcription antitermination factor NusG